MFVFPEDKPVIRGIYSVYIDILRLIEYYLRQVPSGCIHFQGQRAKGVLFFKNQSMINGIVKQDEKLITGQKAVKKLKQATAETPLCIDVLEIPSEQITFWAGVQSAEAIHKNLSTEFTDLKKLLKKMSGEKLTGYIEVRIDEKDETGRIFLVKGKFIGGTYSWTHHRLSQDKKGMEKLIDMTKTLEGLFTVYSVGLSDPAVEPEPLEAMPAHSDAGLKALEILMQHAESTIADDKKVKNDFHTLIKKKFVQFVDKYAFLDPFAAEFEYRNGKISYSGITDVKNLAIGIVDSLQSVMDDCGLSQKFLQKLSTWKDQYDEQAQAWGI
jgi:hypothetical protein